MGIVKDTVSNFIGGVSQQPNKMMFPNQAKKLVNYLLAPIDGLEKRPPSEHSARLMDALTIHPLEHTIIKEDEKYKVIFTGTDIKVFTLDTGVEKSVYYGNVYEVTNGTGTYYTDVRGAKDASVASDTVLYTNITLTTKPASAPTGCHYTGNPITSIKNSVLSYITTTEPLKTLQATTLADYTFILNKTVSTALTSDVFVNPHENSALLFVKQGNYSTSHVVTVDGVTKASYSTTSDINTTGTNTIATNLYNGLNTSYPTKVTRQGSCILLKDVAGNIETQDSNGDRSLYCFYKETDSATDLPTVAPNGFVIKIVGSDASRTDDYYLQFKTVSGDFGKGSWQECCQPNLKYKLDKTTMPIALVREADGNFSLKQLDWTERGAGDEESAPTPSFVGNTIQEVFTHKARLGFLSVDKSIYSDTQDIFSFFKKTTLTELDTDPIDVGSNSKMVLLKHTLPFNEELLMFSESAEFTIKGGNVFSNSTADIDLSMEYACSSRCKPINAGSTAFFVQENGNFTKAYEVFVTSTYGLDAREITEQVPRYLPKNVYKIAGSATNNIAMFLSTDKTDTIYVYNYYYSSEQKQQSAWSEWVFDGGKILNADFYQNYLYLTIQYADGIYSHKVNFSPKQMEDNLNFCFYLDRKVYLDNAVYNATTGQTTFTLPYTPTTGIKAVDLDGFPLDITNISDKHITVAGEYTDIVCGYSYSSDWILSSIYLRQVSQNGSVKVKEGLLMVMDLNLSFNATGYFKAIVTPKYSTQIGSEFEYTGKVVGMTSATLGKISVSDGTFLIPVVSLNEDVEIEIVNDSYLPSCFLSYEWIGDFTTRDA